MQIDDKKYKNIAETRSVYFSDTAKALDLVLKYIIDSQRLIYGGLAIDLALKMTGHAGIYGPDILPDYDIISTDFYNESNQLAGLLYDAGLRNVSSINATHFGSRRVRVNFIPVCDLSYMPEKIHKKVPFLIIKSKMPGLMKFNGMRIVHPDYQRMDLHRSFTVPFKNPPMEVISHRLMKDQSRFKLVDKAYPMMPVMGAEMVSAKGVYPIEFMQNTVLNGYVAYAYLRFVLAAVGQVAGVVDVVKDLWMSDFTIEKGEMKVDMKVVGPITVTLHSENYLNLSDRISKQLKQPVVYYKKYLDNVRPMSAVVQIYEVLDGSEDLLPCYNIQKTLNILAKLTTGVLSKQISEFGDGNQNMYVVAINSLLLYFLQKYYETGDEFQKFMYVQVLRLVESAERLVSGMDKELIGKVYPYLPFFLSPKVYGPMRDVPMQEVGRGMRPPFGYYPENGKDWTGFSMEGNALYMLDGEEMPKPDTDVVAVARGEDDVLEDPDYGRR